MKTLLLLLLFIPSVFAQNLTPEEQRKLLQDVEALKAKVNSLEDKGGSSGGLKRTDYQNTSTEVKTDPAAPAQPAMTPEQMKEMTDTLQKAKEAQAAQQKALQELENEE